MKIFLATFSLLGISSIANAQVRPQPSFTIQQNPPYIVQHDPSYQPLYLSPSQIINQYRKPANPQILIPPQPIIQQQQPLAPPQPLIQQQPTVQQQQPVSVQPITQKTSKCKKCKKKPSKKRKKNGHHEKVTIAPTPPTDTQETQQTQQTVNIPQPIQQKYIITTRGLSLSTFTAPSGHNLIVRTDLVPRWHALISDFIKAGYKPRHIGCYARGGHVPNSRHYAGAACDFDQTGWGQTVPFMYNAHAIIQKHGFRDGCDFNDCGHVDDGLSIRRQFIYSAMRNYPIQRNYQFQPRRFYTPPQLQQYGIPYMRPSLPSPYGNIYQQTPIFQQQQLPYTFQQQQQAPIIQEQNEEYEN
jgi:hypothetical protein